MKKENYSTEKTKKVLHCVRSHRCKDVMPESLEAKIIACIDSASHMTDTVYFDMARDDKNVKSEKFRVIEKLERDYRDLAVFPEVREKLKNIKKAWEELIEAYKKIDL